MPTAAQTIKIRQRRYARKDHSPGVTLGLISGVLLSLVMVIFIFLGLNVYIRLTHNLPSIDLLPSLLEPPHGSLLQPSRMYDRTHQHIILTLENPAAANKQYIRLVAMDGKLVNQALEHLVSATIASDDPKFWDETNSLFNIFSPEKQLNIPKRLIENLLLTGDTPLKEQELGERLLAVELIGKYGRLKILEWYLNSVQYGKFIFGVDAAARTYFAKSVEKLSLAEAAMLVAFEQNPSLDPSIDLASLREIQVQVIFKMLDHGLISSAEAQEALNENIQFQPQLAPESLSPEFTNLVLLQLDDVIPLRQVYQGGFEIITSLDFDLQKQAACASQVQQARAQADTGKETSTIDPACEAAGYLSSSLAIEEVSTQNFDIGVVILSPDSGQILAMVGDDKVDLIPEFPKQHVVGTIVSPLLYLTAFTQGMNPSSLLWDIPVIATGESSGVAGEDRQSDWDAFHGPVSLRTALINDYYGAAAGLYQQVGSENVKQVEDKFGIHSSQIISTTQETIDGFYSQQASLVEIVQAYGILANQGSLSGRPGKENLQQPSPPQLSSSTILSVSDDNGKTWLDWTRPETIPIVSTQLAFLPTHILSDAEVRQSGSIQVSLLDIGRPVAVKLGRSLDDRNTWVVGYTPQIVVGVWMGETQAGYSLAPEFSTDLWQAIIKYTTQGFPRQDFTEPSGITHLSICDPSGMLPSAICPSVKEGVFLSGMEPSQVDNHYQEYWVNRETGLLATIFTPRSLVDQQIYLSVPPQALDWAKQTDFPMPPRSYDTYLPPPSNPEAEIIDPAINAHVGGLVSFYGSAGGDDFAYYRLQIGKGVYPQEWLQLGDDLDKPVKEGLLGMWDTAGLNGDYVVELLVVKQDRQIEQAYLYVTVDNTAPRVKILSPEENAVFLINQDETIIFQASATDDFGLGQVDFMIDDQWIATLYEPPYVALWPAQLGQHVLQVTAYDLAGNHQEKEITFQVTK